MTPERASQIISQAKASATHGPWSDQIDRHMSRDERRELLTVWNTMPGHTCFVDVLHRMANPVLNEGLQNS
jgi:hypothetical protein